MTMVKAIEFETFTVTKEAGKVSESWVVPDGKYVYYAIAEKHNTRAIVSESFFDFQLSKVMRIPTWLGNDMAKMMIEDDSEMYREMYETEMTNGYGTIDASDEMHGDY